jgi:putative transposase
VRQLAAGLWSVLVMSDWPHAPVHRLGEAGAYMVTAGTFRKAHHFAEKARLSFLQETLLHLADKHTWQLQAWAVFSNHYHFVALSPEKADSLVVLIRQLHSLTAREVNRLDGTEGRKVWYEYPETHLTYEKSYLARLHYVHHNAVKHGLVTVPETYPWCSAGWFERTAERAFYQTVRSFKTDTVKVTDDFLPIASRS